MHGKFCKNRICTVCLSIRKADLINKYIDSVQEWPEPYFLTLTVKAVKADKLRDVILNMKQTLKKIIHKYNKQKPSGEWQ
ncbi:MAG: protein rep [Bacteroidetes bacterium]|nr:protein rep [Bacteroidota bacterium]